MREIAGINTAVILPFPDERVVRYVRDGRPLSDDDMRILYRAWAEAYVAAERRAH